MIRGTSFARAAALVLPVACLVLAPSPAAAQIPRRIPVFVVDARASFPGLSQDPVTAQELSLGTADLPGRGLGVSAGVHIYPVRRQRFALGLGGDLLLIRGSAQSADDSGATTAPAVHQEFRSLHGSLSLNFGHRDGWSYVSAGIGPATYATYRNEKPATAPPSKATLHAGGGARWFFSSHLAFTFDVRFHLTRPEVGTLLYPSRQRARLTVLSAGISVR